MTRTQKQLEVIQYTLDKLLEQTLLLRIEQWRDKMTLDDLKAQVQKNTDVEASAVTLIQGIAQQLKDAGNDPAKIQALSDQLKSSADALAAAVTANTPAAP